MFRPHLKHLFYRGGLRWWVMALVTGGMISLEMSAHGAAWESGSIATEWGGHARFIGMRSNPDDRSIYQFVDSSPFFDNQAEVRLNNQLFVGSQLAIETHYELVGRQGDTLKNINRLQDMQPTLTLNRLLGATAIEDTHRLMDLTRTLDQGDDYTLYHRLDRFNLTYTAERTTLRLGRQALTWGNGMLFNPMDLFNPFAPTTIQRDYKIGDDMLHLQIFLGEGELQLLCLPRRDIASGDLESNQSSLAGKWHASMGDIEYDLMAAGHYGDLVLAIGASGYLGGAAWRSDLIYTFLDESSGRSDYWQFVANLDYAWQWGSKNTYGLIEFYFNGLGENQGYARAVSDPAISDRITRGELFTLGRTYLAGQLQMEWHPLLQAGMLAIINLTDPSTVLQPQLSWDVVTNLQVILGASFNLGGNNTEFGGFDVDVAGAAIRLAPADSQYLWVTYYF